MFIMLDFCLITMDIDIFLIQKMTESSKIMILWFFLSLISVLTAISKADKNISKKQCIKG